MSMVVGDIGTELKIDVGQSTAGATGKIVAVAPGQEAVVWDGTTEDTYVVYTIESGDLAIPGRWYFQAYLDYGVGAWSGYSQPVTETVYPRLTDATV